MPHLCGQSTQDAPPPRRVVVEHVIRGAQGHAAGRLQAPDATQSWGRASDRDREDPGGDQDRLFFVPCTVIWNVHLNSVTVRASVGIHQCQVALACGRRRK